MLETLSLSRELKKPSPLPERAEMLHKAFPKTGRLVVSKTSNERRACDACLAFDDPVDEIVVPTVSHPALNTHCQSRIIEHWQKVPCCNRWADRPYSFALYVQKFILKDT